MARVVLIELADKTLDLQYYIFRKDASGAIILEHLIAAAERGVKVRLLLDDWGTFEKSEEATVALDAHPNIEVRLFNPYVRPFGIGTIRQIWNSFTRVNRRMHNKQIIADRSAVILGGRNIGDEYFNIGAFNFQDIDVLGLGTIANEAGVSFDAYWNSPFAVPVKRFVKHAESRALVFRARRRKLFGKVDRSIFVNALQESALGSELRERNVRLLWSRGALLYDPPDKLSKPPEANSDNFLGAKLSRRADDAKSELLAMSPYFVPGDVGVEFLGKKKKQGITIRILTNSLAATDAWVVHAGYRKYRRAMLEHGVRIYELKPEAQRGSGVKGLEGRTRSSLHGKTFVFDRNAVFVGSLNIDPRSLRQNTECGVLIEDPEMSEQVSQLFKPLEQPGAFIRGEAGRGP